MGGGGEDACRRGIRLRQRFAFSPVEPQPELIVGCLQAVFRLPFTAPQYELRLTVKFIRDNDEFSQLCGSMNPR